jgi:ParB-like chromosome segregation protein Spo0J
MNAFDPKLIQESQRQAWPVGAESMSVSMLKPYARNARTHSRKQIKKIAASIERFGFVNPVLIDEDHQIIAGHGRVAAAKTLGLNEVPVLRVEHLSEQEKCAYILADTRLAEDARSNFCLASPRALVWPEGARIAVPLNQGEKQVHADRGQ